MPGFGKNLPDGFGQSGGPSGDGGFIYGPDGRKLYKIDHVEKSQRDKFAQSGVEFDGFAEVEALQDAKDAVKDIVADKIRREMSPELKRIIEPLVDIDE